MEFWIKIAAWSAGIIVSLVILGLAGVGVWFLRWVLNEFEG